MKKLLIFTMLVPFLINCSSSNGEMQREMEKMEEMEGTPATSGDFVTGAHVTTGSVSVSSDKKTLNFTDFKTDSGPQLLVYLTTAVGSTDYVSLGDLKGISGDYSYSIPANTDLAKYKIVDIWCVAASVSFGHAELK